MLMVGIAKKSALRRHCVKTGVAERMVSATMRMRKVLLRQPNRKCLTGNPSKTKNTVTIDTERREWYYEELVLF